MLLGLNLAWYALVAADSRQVFYLPGGAARVDDRARRIHRTAAGLALGDGTWGLVNAATKAMALRPDVVAHPRATVDFLSDYSRRRLRAGAAARGLPCDAAESGWVLTSATDGRLHITAYHSARSFEPIDASEREPIIMFPADVCPEARRRLQSELLAALRPARSALEAYGTLDHNVGTLVEFFRALLSISCLVGPRLQIGFQSIFGDVEVTPVLLPADLESGLAGSLA